MLIGFVPIKKNVSTQLDECFKSNFALNYLHCTGIEHEWH